MKTNFHTIRHMPWLWRCFFGGWLLTSMIGSLVLMVADLTRLVILPNIPHLEIIPNWMWTLGTCLKADIWEQMFYLLLHALVWGSLIFLPHRTNHY